MSEFNQLETKTKTKTKTNNNNDINNDIQWTCETCTFLNHVELQECEMCATVKPDTNANDTNANATNANDTNANDTNANDTNANDTNANDTNATDNATDNADLNQAKQILSKLQPDIQTHILEEYVKPQVIADEISNMIKEFDELLMSDKCQRLEWRVLTEVVSKIINNKAALAQMCEKDTMGFKDSYEQHFIKGKNAFRHPSWTPLGSMCAELTMRQWH